MLYTNNKIPTINDTSVRKTLIIADKILASVADEKPLIYENAALLVCQGRIAKIDKSEKLLKLYPNVKKIGGAGLVAIPGFINSHHHVGLTPFQLGSPDLPLELWFASRIGLRVLDPYLDTLYSAFEMISSGITTVQHLHPRAMGGREGLVKTSEAVLSAYSAIGMRVSFSMALRNQNRLVYWDDNKFIKTLPEGLRPAISAYLAEFDVPISDQLAIFNQLSNQIKEKELQRVQLAPSNLHWLSDKALELIGALSEELNVPMHAHMLETPYQWEYARRRCGGSAVNYFRELGLLNQRLTIGHGVWMDQSDIELCKEAGCHICHNCSSNLRLKSGTAPINRFVDSGIPVAIGIDEAGINDDRDMFQEMRLALNIHREPGFQNLPINARQIFKMATENGANTTPFSSYIGSLLPGKAADIVLLDWKEVTWPYQNSDLGLVDIIVRRACTSGVKSVLIGGELVFENGKFTNMDRASVTQQIIEALSNPLNSSEVERKKMSEDILPYVQKFYDDYRLPNNFNRYRYGLF